MADSDEPAPSEMLYVMDGVQTRKLQDAFVGVTALIRFRDQKPDIMNQDAADILVIVEKMLSEALDNIYVHHDPRIENARFDLE